MVTFRYSTWPPLPLALRQVSTTSLMCSPSAAALTSFGLDLSACLEKLMSLNSALPVPPPPPRQPPPMLVTPHEKLSISISPLCFSSRRSEEHTSELQSLMLISYSVLCLTNKKYITR